MDRTGTQVTNTYDSCTNGIGQLCTASSTAAKDTYAYDVLSRTVGATTTIAGKGYGLAYGYDRQGNITSVTNNTDSSQLNYIYNTAGLVSAVNRTIGGVNSLVASMFNFSPTSQLGQAVFGSGASTTYSYTAAALYRLTRILTQGAATTTTTITTSTTTNSLDSYWKFDESSGNPQDSVGSNPLTNSNSATFTSGLINNAINLNGSTQYATAADSSSLDPVNAFTACAWAYPTSVSNTMTIISKNYSATRWETAGAYTSFLMRMDTGPDQVQVDVTTGGSTEHTLLYNYTPSANTWYYFCETYDGSTLKLYVNGSEVDSGSVTGSIGYDGGAFVVGSDNSGSDYFQGKIDETGLWSRALSSSEISNLYNSGAGLQYPFGSTTATSTHDIKLQDLNYLYDADGNILSRTDSSDLQQGQETTYTYDDLNRLLSASASAGDIAPYTQSYTYDPLGNILTGPDGAYSYQGNTGSSYANPDAVTQILLTSGASARTIAYDNSAVSGSGTDSSSLTFSYTTNNSTNGLILVSVEEATTSPCTSDKVTGVTVNGTSLTDLGYYANDSHGVLRLLSCFGRAQHRRIRERFLCPLCRCRNLHRRESKRHAGWHRKSIEQQRASFATPSNYHGRL
jgi:YD repeat-containing protein